MKLKNCIVGTQVYLKECKDFGIYEILDIDKNDPSTKVRIKHTEDTSRGFWARHKDLKVVKK